MRNFLPACVAAGLAILCACSKEPLEEYSLPGNAIGVKPLTYKDSVFVMTQRVDSVNMLALINAYRSKGCKCGDTLMAPAPPLAWNIRLERAAWLHSKEMKDSIYLSHTGKNGSTAGDRIRKMGYNWKAYAENLALGVLNEKTIVDGWMGSKTHCISMMNTLLKETGIARQGNFWAQELALAH